MSFCQDMPSLEEISRHTGCERIPQILKKYSFTEEEINKYLPNEESYIISLSYSDRIYRRCRWGASVLLGIGNPLEKITKLYFPLDFIACLDDQSVIRALIGDLNDYCKVLYKCPYCGEYNFNFSVKEAEIYYNTEEKFKCRECVQREVFEEISKTIEERNHKRENTYRMSKLKCKYPFSSLLEAEVFDTIHSIYDGEFILHNRSLLDSKLEVDIYYPKKHIGIEINGDFWHRNESSKIKCREGIKEDSYHTSKFLDGLKNKILIVNIFESDWRFKNKQIVSYLEDLFNNRTNKLSYINEEEINLNFPLPFSSMRKLKISEKKIIPASFISSICKGCVISGVGHYKIVE